MADGSPSPAEVYYGRFVRAVFGPWGKVLADMSGAGAGDHALDVACGSGAATLALLERVGSEDAVTGLDANPEMLAVARRKSDRVTWLEGRVEALPWDGPTFDAVTCQFGVMFFEDRAQALREMRRVLRPGGTMVVAACGRVERSEAYAEFARLLDRLFDPAVGDAFRAPFVPGDASDMEDLARAAGLDGARVVDRSQSVAFPSVDDMIAAERACVWTLGGILNDEPFARLMTEAPAAFAPWTQEDAVVSFDMPAPILLVAGGAP